MVEGTFLDFVALKFFIKIFLVKIFSSEKSKVFSQNICPVLAMTKYKQCSFVILSDVRKMLIPSYLLALSMCIKKGYSFRVFDQLSRKIIFDSSRFRTSRILRAQVFHIMVNLARFFRFKNGRKVIFERHWKYQFGLEIDKFVRHGFGLA